MTATELLAAITAAGGELRRMGDRLSVDISAPLAPELVGYLHELKGELLSFLAQDPQGASEVLPSVFPDHARCSSVVSRIV